MRMTFSLPDDLAQKFLATVPNRERSMTVAKLLEQELSQRENKLAAACHAANEDESLNAEIAEWQAFDEELTD